MSAAGPRLHGMSAIGRREFLTVVARGHNFKVDAGVAQAVLTMLLSVGVWLRRARESLLASAQMCGLLPGAVLPAAAETVREACAPLLKQVVAMASCTYQGHATGALNLESKGVPKKVADTVRKAVHRAKLNSL